MTQQEAYRRQAGSDLRMLDLLLQQPDRAAPDCHRLHYLQMATGQAAKAVVHALGGDLPSQGYSHAFVRSLVQALKRGAIAAALGWSDFRQYKAMLESVRPLLHAVEQLRPTEDLYHPNVEYPWLERGPKGTDLWQVPADHSFDVDPRSRRYTNLIVFVRRLLDRLDELATLRRRPASRH